MEIFRFFILIIGALIITHSLVYLKVRPKAFSNVFPVVTFVIITVGLTLLLITHASWWSVAIHLYVLLLLRMSVCNHNGKLWDFGYGYGIRSFLKVILSWVTLIIIILMSFKMIMLYSTWYVTIVYLPIVILPSIGLIIHFKDSLESLSWLNIMNRSMDFLGRFLFPIHFEFLCFF